MKSCVFTNTPRQLTQVEGLISLFWDISKPRRPRRDERASICLFGVLRRFQHCTGHITTGSWKGRGNQYI